MAQWPWSAALERMAAQQAHAAQRLEALEHECARLAAEAAQHSAVAAKAVLAADLAQRAERRAREAMARPGAGWGVGDGRRVGLEDDLETLDT